MTLSTIAPEVREHLAPLRSFGKVPARFTLDGSEALERHLENACEKVLAGVRRIIPPGKLEGLALGGGYGRGEGGVLKSERGDEPYNDLEFYVFVRGPLWLNEKFYARELHDLAETLTPSAGLDVELKLASLGKIRRSATSMFFYDLVTGHRLFAGDENLFSGCEHHRDARRIPLSEATRLMMNRCSGLLFAREKLEREKFTEDDADFANRNIAKAQLALGDAVLTVFGQYDASCIERHRRLQQLFPIEKFSWFESVQQHHDAGVRFKLHPHRPQLAREPLLRRHREVAALALEIWLWLENHRLDCDFKTAAEYTSSRIVKCPGTNPLRNWLTNLKVFGTASLLSARGFRHPRERIFNALTLLLWCGGSREIGQKIRDELFLSRGFEDFISAYRSRWQRVN
jgi:hypothetical protein